VCISRPFLEEGVKGRSQKRIVTVNELGVAHRKQTAAM
jgi:hypothetical protein